MDPKEAAVALELLGAERCIPCHWGTFPVLAGTPDELRRLTDVDVVDVSPGDTVEI
jgi:L-ascorbate metabolism protein UlaG (beta-lactamase superfamily)